MSLTFLGRMIAIAAFGAILFPLFSAYALPLASYLVEARASTDQPARFQSRALVYRIMPEHSLTFAFSRPASETKIIVQPAVKPELRSFPPGFVYGLRLRLFDSEGAVTEEHDVYLQGDAPDQVYASGEKWRFFRNRPEMVAGQDEVVMSTEAAAARMEITLIDPDPGIIAVDVRVYEQHVFLGNNAITTFHRRSESEQRTLASANAFPPSMLTDQEMNHIALNMWRPIGPLGIEGRDYDALVLYEASMPPDARKVR